VLDTTQKCSPVSLEVGVEVVVPADTLARIIPKQFLPESALTAVTIIFVARWLPSGFTWGLKVSCVCKWHQSLVSATFEKKEDDLWSIEIHAKNLRICGPPPK